MGKLLLLPVTWPLHVWRWWNDPIPEDAQGWPALITLPW